jgi:gamma-glutamylcyclotransferase (GGCT)/AIG2-like uncharacterized protein YtfP
MDDTLLARCDRLEDHPDYYRLDITPLANGREAWMYRLPAAWFPHHPRIPTGDWADAA